MDFDPVNRDVPAPRYELESGSEDEFEARLEVAADKTPEPFRIVTTDGSDATGVLEHGTQLVILVGNAGASFLASLQSAVPTQRLSLQTVTEQHAAIAVIESASGTKLTVALVAPPPQLRASRLHDITRTLLETTLPSSLVIVDSYSPQEELYRDPYSEDAEESAGADSAIRYLATPSYVAKHEVHTKRMAPLRSPEAATGLGAAFLATAVVRNIPAILTLLEDVSFQSHIQLYGSLGAARLSASASEALAVVTGLNDQQPAHSQQQDRTILDFVASRRIKPSANLSVLGDGNMYI